MDRIVGGSIENRVIIVGIIVVDGNVEYAVIRMDICVRWINVMIIVNVQDLRSKSNESRDTKVDTSIMCAVVCVNVGSMWDL